MDQVYQEIIRIAVNNKGKHIVIVHNEVQLLKADLIKNNFDIFVVIVGSNLKTMCNNVHNKSDKRSLSGVLKDYIPFFSTKY